MKVGIMGGTLDPVHNGHLMIARAVCEAMSLDYVLLLPAGDPPHKSGSVGKQDRMNMVRLATEGEDKIAACDLEVNREGTTYTFDTLTELHEMYPDNEWYYIVGADTVEVLDSWRNFKKIAKLTRFVGVGRPGIDNGTALLKAQWLKDTYGARIDLIDAIEGPDISSTEIRARVAKGESIRGIVPEKVEAYIRENGLYLCNCTWDKVHDQLKERLNEKRYIHTLGVADTAVRLAKIHGEDAQRARLAGLLHDCAKYMDRKEMFRYVRENVPDTDEEELSMTSVVHAPAGMLVAKDVFGVSDEQILSSIRKHTLGDAQMCPMDLIIYIADFIEPNREMFDGLEEARKLAEEDLEKCAVYCAELSGKYVLAKGYEISSRTVKMIENLKLRRKNT